MNIVYRGVLECEDIMLVLAFKKACDIKRCRAIDANLYYIEIDSDSKVFQENKSWSRSLDFNEYFKHWLQKNPQFLQYDRAIRGMTWTGLDDHGVYKHTNYPVVKCDEGTWHGDVQAYRPLYSNLFIFSTYAQNLTVSIYQSWEELADGIDR